MAEDERDLTLTAAGPTLLVTIAKPQLAFSTRTQVTYVSVAVPQISSELTEVT